MEEAHGRAVFVTISELALEWQWNHNPDNDYWSLTARRSWLRLTTGSICGSLTNARNTLTQRTFGPKCSGSVYLDVSNMKNGDYTGLAALQEIYGFVGVKMNGNDKYIIMAEAAEQREKQYQTGIPANETERVKLEQEMLYLRIDFDFKEAVDEAYFYYSLEGINWQRIGKKLKMSYRLSHFTGYRFALFNYATKTVGGYVDFDWFKCSNICDRMGIMILE